MKENYQAPFDIWRNSHSVLKNDFSSRKTSFVNQLIPEIAVNLNIFEILTLLQQKFGTEALTYALNPENTIPSPVATQTDTSWLKTSKMVGVNIRTIGNFFNLVKYLTMVGACHDSVHILPIWEPGVVASLYGKISWNINPEFFSHEMQRAIPSLYNVERQLKVVTNLIHLMGKTVGLDVIPHTDRFSELVFLYPQLFEWVHRKGHEIISVSTQNAHEVENIIWEFLMKNGSANGSYTPVSKEVFFEYGNPLLTDHQKLEIIFGRVDDREWRLRRRLDLMQQLLYAGYETMPVTMAPPYRGLHLVENDFIYDDFGNKWYNYQFDKPEGMSRVFGPLTRYKLYHTVSETSQELDFENPNKIAWDYIATQYNNCVTAYNFDFMRGDMAHVQPRAAGVPTEIGTYYDPLKYIKNYVQQKGKPYFGFFAETFLAPPDTMGYGDEVKHLEAIDADSTLGDLQAEPVGSELFMENFERYIDLLETQSFAPNFTMITADKDDPRFDSFYKKGNHLRFFVGIFLDIMPSYMSLGFECRNAHLERAANEEYTKLYVFQITEEAETDKVTHGPFVWGKNYEFFSEIESMKLIYDEIFREKPESFKWIKKPSKSNFVTEWSIGDYLFVANFNPTESLAISTKKGYEMIYSTADFVAEHECRVYKRIA